jgi:hypothetical protein
MALTGRRGDPLTGRSAGTSIQQRSQRWPFLLAVRRRPTSLAGGVGVRASTTFHVSSACRGCTQSEWRFVAKRYSCRGRIDLREQGRNLASERLNIDGIGRVNLDHRSDSDRPVVLGLEAAS